MGLFSAEPTEKVAADVLDEFRDLDGIQDVVDGILALQENKIYEKLVHMDNPIDSSVDPRYASKTNEYSDLELFAAIFG